MIRLIFSLALAWSIFPFPPTAIAETSDSPYLGIQYAIGDASVPELNQTFAPTTLIGRVGRHYRKHFAFEGRIAFPLHDDSKVVAGTDTSVGLFGLLGGYGAARLTLRERYSFYGIAGMSLVAWEIGRPVDTDSRSDFELSYGFGADIDVGMTILNIEYFSYTDDEEFDFDTLGLGLKIVF